MPNLHFQLLSVLQCQLLWTAVHQLGITSMVQMWVSPVQEVTSCRGVHHASARPMDYGADHSPIALVSQLQMIFCTRVFALLNFEPCKYRDHVLTFEHPVLWICEASECYLWPITSWHRGQILMQHRLHHEWVFITHLLRQWTFWYLDRILSNLPP